MVLEEFLTELGVGATNSEATRVFIFLGRGAKSGGLICAVGARNVEKSGAAQWRCAASCAATVDKSTSEPSLSSSRGLHCALA